MTDELKKYGAAILCGGKSRRMGFDKSVALRSRDGRPLLAAQAEELSRNFGEVALITNNRHKLAAITELKKFTVLEDLHPGVGPAGAIHTALKGLPNKPLFIMACDMPVIDWSVIEQMRILMEEHQADVVTPRHGDLREPLYAFYGPAAEPAFREGLEKGHRKVWVFYDTLKTMYLDLKDKDFTSGVFKNLNTPADLQKEGLPTPQAAGTTPPSNSHTLPFEILRYKGGRFNWETDLVVEERRVDIFVGGRLYASVMATPSQLDCLAIGYLFSEGVIKNPSEITGLKVNGLRVDIELAGRILVPPARARSSGFGLGSVTLEDTDPGSFHEKVSPPDLTPQIVINLMEEFNQRSELFRQTGAVHSGMLVCGSDRFFAEDVGRHNAIDKAVGQYLSSGKAYGCTGLILTTGRVSTEMVFKTAKAGMGGLISRGSASRLAVELARKINMILIGFSRGDRFKVFNGGERFPG